MTGLNPKQYITFNGYLIFGYKPYSIHIFVFKLLNFAK